MSSKSGKPLNILVMLALMAITCGYKFPDAEINWQNATTYKPDKLIFNKTTATDVQKNYALNEKVIKINNEISYIPFEPNDNADYDYIRVGFKNDVLDWIQFTFRKVIKTQDIIDIYGEPSNINSTYDADFDFFNYGNFNFSTDKKHLFVNSISVFGLRKDVPTTLELQVNVPKWDEFNSTKGLVVGQTMEQDFKKLYQDITPQKKSTEKSVYELNEYLGNSKLLYTNVRLYFENGILTQINLEPNNLMLTKFNQIYHQPIKKETLNTKYSILEYKNFMCVVDEHAKKIINVGIIN